MLALFVCASFMGAGALPMKAQAETADAARYGTYPANYKEIVTEWNGDPKPADLGTKGEHLYGYLVSFKVNARNRFGTYTGKQTHGALIRDGEVIKGIGFAY